MARKAFDWMDGLYKIGIFGFWVNNTRGRQRKGSFLWPRLERDWELQEDVSSLGASATKGRKPASDQTHQKPAWYSPPEMSSAGGEIWLSKFNSRKKWTSWHLSNFWIWDGPLIQSSREYHSTPIMTDCTLNMVYKRLSYTQFIFEWPILSDRFWVLVCILKKIVTNSLLFSKNNIQAPVSRTNFLME